MGDETIDGDKFAEEIRRAKAIANLSTEVMKIASLRLEAAKIVAEYGQGDPTQYLPEPPRVVTVEL